MENFKIYLYFTNPISDTKMRMLLGIFGILFLSLGIFLTYYYDYPFGNLYVMTSGIIALILALVYNKFIKRCYISLDEQGIKAARYSNDLDWRNPFAPFIDPPHKINVKWEEMKSIYMEPFKIKFDLKDGSSQEIQIGDLMYKQHQLLKTQLQAYMQEKGID